MSASIVQSGNIYNTAGGDVNIITTVIGSSNDSNLASRREKVSRWLFDIGTVNHYAIQNEMFAKIAPGTASWILETAEFEAWISEKSTTFWGVGIPGAGKTILTSFVINHIEEHAQADKPTVIYAYCRFNDGLNVVRILANLLGQLVNESSLALSYISEKLYASHSQRGITPTDHALTTHLRSALTKISSNLYIVVDALDELKDDVREQLVDVLLSLERPLFLTSRELSLTSLSEPSIHIRAPSKDIATFIHARIKHLPKLSSLLKNRQDILDELINEVTSKSDGMFLLAALQLVTLGQVTNIKNLKKSLATQPTTLNEMYQLTQERLLSQNEEESSLATRAILWVTYAGQPLVISELLEAVALEPDTTELDPDALTNRETIISVCCGLLTIEDRTGLVRLIHYTTYDFFSRSRELFKTLDQDPHTYAATICIVYLNLADLHAHHITNSPKLIEFTETYPFSTYTCNYLGYHTIQATKECGDCVPNTISHLLSENTFIPIPMNSKFAHSIDYGNIVHFSACYGVPLVSQPDLELWSQRSAAGYTPLHYAVDCGHKSFLQWLLNFPTLDVNEGVNGDEQTALIMAAANGFIDIVEMLLNCPRVNINGTDKYGTTALHLLSEYGIGSAPERIMQQLLKHPGIDVNIQDSNGNTAIHIASEYGYISIVQLLLHFPGTSVNIENKNSETPLALAQKRGQMKIVEILRDFKARGRA